MDPDPAPDSTMPEIWPLILVFGLLVLVRAYFSSAESAFSAMNRIRIKAEADDGKRRAKAALYISNNFDRAITTLLIGNNLAGVAGSAVAPVVFTHLMVSGRLGNISSDTVTVLCTLVTTLLFFLFSEMIPKALANDRPETLARLYAPGLRIIMKIFKPLAIALNALGKAFMRLFKGEEPPSITEEELYDIADTAEEEGVLNEEQTDLFKSALEYGNTEVSDIMTMRQDIIYADIHMTNEEILEIIETHNVSRLPICDGSLDRVIGILPMRSFMRRYLQNPRFPIRKLMLMPFYVRDIAFIHDCMEIMREQKFTMAIVLDKNDRAVGLITVEDILEELVGEIFDESDVVDQNFIKKGGNHFEVNPELSVGEVLSRMKYRCRDYRILSLRVRDWVTENLGSDPEEDDSFTYRNLRITVSEVEDGRIQKVIFHIDPDITDTDPPKGGDRA